jgi:glucuronoarabinoxylan endo-1,4-beta-xylanase
MRKSRLPQSLLPVALFFSSASPTQAADVTVDRATKYQTIEGFGFFGAMDSWWGNPNNLVSDAWAAQALGDLGISMWRNEYYPPADSLASQDADWAKQKPVVLTLKRLADANQIPLRVILTVWSPPSTMKCKADSQNNYLPIEGTAPQSTKNGNTLCQGSWADFANWLIAGLQLYKDAGVDVYGLSFQNEPYFYQPYNSCFYVQPYYAQTLAAIAPKIKAAFPSVKLFGSENMLEMEAGGSKDYFYTSEIKKAGAQGALDALAVHGYNDGLVPTATTKMATLWTTMASYFAQPLAKPLWMTETSGYLDTWTASAGSDGKTLPGASDLAYSMYAALNYGHVSAWVWWQGSELNGPSAYSLMAGTKTLSKRYYVSKQFFRFVRPGAVMVKATSADSSVLALAFEHAAMGSLTTILINSSDQPKSISLTGTDVPTSLTLYTTTASDNCANAGTVSANAIALPPNSVNTVVSGNVYESGSPVFSGAGGAPGSGGATGAGGATGSGGRTGGGAGGATGRRDGGAGATGGAIGSGGRDGGRGAGGAVGTGGRGVAGGSGGVIAAADGAAPISTGGAGGPAGAQGGEDAAGAEVGRGTAGAGGVVGTVVDADLTPIAAPDAADDVALGAPEGDGATPFATAIRGSGCGCDLGAADRSRAGSLLLVLALAILFPAKSALRRRRQRTQPIP